MTIIIVAYFAVLGAILGSFLNVVGLRFLKEESLVTKRSYCYGCGHQIRWIDNIPVLSWCVLGGKCRDCKAPISWQYPVVEALTAALFALTVYQYGVTWETAFYLFLIANLVVILITDFREHYIFDINSLGLIPVGLLFSGLSLSGRFGQQALNLFGWHVSVSAGLISALIALLGAFLVFYLLNLFSKLTIGRPGFGEGDTRLLMGLGAFFGLNWMLVIFAISFVLQVIVGIPMLINQWIKAKAYQALTYFGVGVVFAILPYVAQALLPQGLILLGVALLCCVGALWASLKGLSYAKEVSTGLTYLPFGPALVFATLILLFAHQQVLPFIKHLLGFST